MQYSPAVVKEHSFATLAGRGGKVLQSTVKKGLAMDLVYLDEFSSIAWIGPGSRG